VDAERVGASVEKRLYKHATRLWARLGQGEHKRAEGAPRSLPAAEAATLALFAQEGATEEHDQADEHDAMRDVAGRLAALLWSRPIDGCEPSAGPLDPSALDDLNEPITLVLVAAWARCELARGEGITARQLGALAELDARSVRRLAEAGELRWQSGPGPLRASAADALRWLEARGVRGLPREKRGKPWRKR